MKKTKKRSTTLKKKTLKPRPKKVSAIPKDYNHITPHLMVSNGAKAIEFYKKAFGAKQVKRMDAPNGKIGHAELKIGDTKIMLADLCHEGNVRTPEECGGSSIGIHLYVNNVDLTVKRALSLGAKLERAVEDMFYGDRNGTLKDPFGHIWYVSTHIEDVTAAQMRKRAAALYSGK